jgi:hypothetical protein
MRARDQGRAGGDSAQSLLGGLDVIERYDDGTSKEYKVLSTKYKVRKKQDDGTDDYSSDSAFEWNCGASKGVSIAGGGVCAPN